MTDPSSPSLSAARMRLLAPRHRAESTMALLGAAGFAALAALALSAAVILGPPAAISPHHPMGAATLRLD